jgi:L-lysine 2,3-aminomutase
MSDVVAYRALGPRQLEALCRRGNLSTAHVRRMQAVAHVLPFRTNTYVVDELIDWEDVPDDPIFQMTFPQPEMLPGELVEEIVLLRARDVDSAMLRARVAAIRSTLNPHPGGQLELNVPAEERSGKSGLQHKYEQTVLFFPSSGQTCHAYCSYCFRWAQFVGDGMPSFGARNADGLVRYLGAHREVTDVLLTGGDPLVMRSVELARFVEPLLRPDLDTVATIRIGTKSICYWPQRFLSDDGDEVLRLFERVVGAGRHLALMAHISHPRELRPPAVEQALRRIRDTGAVVYCQAPLIQRVNDDAATWLETWRREIQLGCVPYYMFVERDTGPYDYFKVPLARAVELFRDAYASAPGLARTVRGPVMSTTPGKVLVEGVADVAGEQAFVLRYIQARDASRVGRPFFARYDPEATWMDQLQPLAPQSAAMFECATPRVDNGAEAKQPVSL